MFKYWNREEAIVAANNFSALLGIDEPVVNGTMAPSEGTVIRVSDQFHFETKEYAHTLLALWHNGMLLTTLNTDEEIDALVDFMKTFGNASFM